MTLKEIIHHEDISGNQIHLYREGLFWKAYEHSAYRFVFGVNPYKPFLMNSGKRRFRLRIRILKPGQEQGTEKFNIEEEILRFNIESKTPIECMTWLSALKQKIKEASNEIN